MSAQEQGDKEHTGAVRAHRYMPVAAAHMSAKQRDSQVCCKARSLQGHGNSAETPYLSLVTHKTTENTR